MARKPNSSPQTQVLLGVLMQDPNDWRYGYDLSRATGLKSGTLYPILVRLEDAGMLEEQWQASSVPGKPSRHMYRLTALGQAEASAILTSVVRKAPVSLPSTVAEGGAH